MINQLAQLLAEEREKGKSTVVNLGDDNEDPIYPQKKTRVELPKQLKDRCRWLEEKFKVMENFDYHCGIDANDLSLVSDLVLPPKFKTSDFEKYNRTSCPEAHITMFCRRMTEYVNNDQLLIHCFQDSLIRSAVKWYNQLSSTKINSWKDLAEAFIKQYSHVTDMTPDRITLQNMEKKQNERQAICPKMERGGNAVMSGEMIENAVRSGKIDAEKTLKDRLRGRRKTRALVQNLMDNKELEFFEYAKGSEREEVCASEEGKKVPWNYDCNVTILGEENPVSASEEGQEVGFYTHSKRRDPSNAGAEPVKGKTPMVEQMKEKTVRLKSPVNEPQLTRKSVLALLLSSETNCDALMKVLNETYIANDISVNKLDRLINNMSVEKFIFFNDDEIPPGGMGSTKALHITTRCKWYTLPGVLIDNRSELNFLPLSTLNRLYVDSSHMKTCQNIVRAFDGTERRVMRRIEIPLLIGPNTYEVEFLVMDIKPSSNCLLGRLLIHTARAVPSLLYQELKLVTDDRLVTINAEEDIVASVTSDAPYVGTNDEAIECSFRSLEFVNATFIIEGNKILIPKISKTIRMGLQLTVGKGAFTGKGLGKDLENAYKERNYSSGKKDAKGRDCERNNDIATDSESPFEQDMCTEDSQDFEDDRDYNLSPDLLRMI
ncbi:Gag-pro-like protein [Gossypium australe]|uniref:Gag-pro-like protein n=1 Tax=Gossypium australe TaxID=47621 RepID=A0A5B6UZF0_9ROSI|nr:Gag-pro-like protein [Gossypium australe]